ncbi:MAG: transglycosylase domain-containing protein [Gammaproteobacteria bacterium]|nr:transglycosylase domain-containing protein [Gammaproteobacteria bacterium]
MLLATTAVALFGLIAATAWYDYAIRIARQQTPQLVQTAFQRYGTALQPTDLSPERKAMLLAIEDPTFLQHHGVDLSTPGAGMTTITQGLVKQLYFPQGFRPGIAKIRQTLIAQYALDSLVSKDEQLRLFLNISYLGEVDGKAVHGFAAAARTYFGKEFAALNDEEFLSLVAMLIGPNNLKPGTPANVQRMQRIHAYLRGETQPASLLDVDYKGKQSGSLAEEILMGFLRLLTDANPHD